jgi:hypothetical protein
MSYSHLALLSIAGLIILLSSGCTVQSCDATLSSILVVPFASPVPINRPNSCSLPNDGPSPIFYQGPWSSNTNDLGLQNATVNSLLLHRYTNVAIDHLGSAR